MYQYERTDPDGKFVAIPGSVVQFSYMNKEYVPAGDSNRTFPPTGVSVVKGRLWDEYMKVPTI